MAKKSVRRRAKPRREVEAGDGMVARLADQAFENPAMSGGLLVMALTVGAIVSNAMFLQAGRHPEPIFATRPANAPQAATPTPSSTAPASVPIPRSRADSVAESSEAPPPPDPVPAASDQPTETALIADIQRELARLGLYADAIDGIAGSRTKTAISAYEAAAGLPVTGETSTALLEALKSPTETAPAKPAEVAPVEAAPVEPVTTESTEVAAAADGSTDLTVAEQERAAAEEQARYFRVQAALNLIGYGPITVDGKAGDQTAEAIRRFELDNGLPITGKVDDRLIERLVAIGAMQSM